jgi:hypothetical protein
MKKKWIAVVVTLICCLVYAIVKLSMSELQNVSENQNAYKQPEGTQSAKQINADDTDKATPEEGSGSTVPADQVEAVTHVFSELRSAVVNEDYEQAWMLVSEVVRSRTSFEEFKESVAGAGNEMAKAIIRPESSINIEGRVGLLLTGPTNEANEDREGGIYFFFIEENGQWKFWGAENAKYVDTSKE